MNSKQAKIELAVRTIQLVSNFIVAPSLPGSKHRFTFNGLDFEISLPGKPQRKHWRQVDAHINCYHEINTNSSKYKPRCFTVNRVFCEVNLGRTATLSGRQLKSPRRSSFGKRERERFDRMVDKHRDLTAQGFEYWLGLLRWRSGNHLIGLAEERTDRSRVLNALIRKDTGMQICPPLIKLTALEPRIFTKRNWSAVQTDLQTGTSVPLWHSYYTYASQHLHLGRDRDFILCLAIALETSARKVVATDLVRPNSGKFVGLVGKISIMALVEKWDSMGFRKRHWQHLTTDKKHLRKLIELRNGIMHRGLEPKLSSTEKRNLQTAVEAFTKAVDSELSSV